MAAGFYVKALVIMRKINGTNHITFATSNLERATNFYTEILGCEVVATWEQGAYLLAGDLWLCLSCDENTKSRSLNEYTHIAFSVSESDIQSFKKIVSEKNIPVWKENKSEGDSLYILDPDYNKLELHASNLEKRIEHMRKNPYPGMAIYKKLPSSEKDLLQSLTPEKAHADELEIPNNDEFS